MTALIYVSCETWPTKSGKEVNGCYGIGANTAKGHMLHGTFESKLYLLLPGVVFGYSLQLRWGIPSLTSNLADDIGCLSMCETCSNQKCK